MVLLWLAVLPSIIIGIFIYRLDRMEKEPAKELIKAFLMGLCAILLTLIISFIFKINPDKVDFSSLFEIFMLSFFGIALVEELSKWLFTYIFLKKNKNFNYLFDGVVYTTIVSLGFATIENVIYTLSGGVLTGVIRAFTSVPAHAFFGIISGYYLSLSKKNKVRSNKRQTNIYLFLSLFIPFLLHGFYDFCLLSGQSILFLVYLLFMIFLYIFSIRKIKYLVVHEELFIKKDILFCIECGTKVKGDFCSNCGRKIEVDS